MPEMTDPMDALMSMQQAIELREPMHFERGRIHADIMMHADAPIGIPRFTYAKIDRQIVKALSIFSPADPFEGLPCFGVGYAVAIPFRGHGLGVELLSKGVDELKNGFRGTGAKKFYVEAVIAISNAASIKVAEKVLGFQSEKCTDSYSGQPSVVFRLLATC